MEVNGSGACGSIESAALCVVSLKVFCQFETVKEEVHSAPSTQCRRLPPAALASTQTPHIRLKWPTRGVPCMFYTPNSNRLVGNLCSTLSLFLFKGACPLKHSLSKKTNLLQWTEEVKVETLI